MAGLLPKIGVPDPLALVNNLNPFKKKQPAFSGRDKHDFPGGFVIVEIIAGVETKRGNTNGYVELVGTMMPKQPFGYGGSQRMKKDFYPGHSEPTVHVFGAEESNTTIKGVLKDKKYSKADLGASEAIVNQLDNIRRRGNLCKFQMGSWKRYGFIEKTSFELNTRRWIEYNIDLSIIGFNPPIGCKIVGNAQDVPSSNNNALINAALAWQNKSKEPQMDENVFDLINGLISDVATSIALVTNFVSKVIGAGENLSKSAYRAIGLIKNARTNISVFQRRVGIINWNSKDIVKTVKKLTTARLASQKYIASQISQTQQLEQLLARLQKQFEANAVTFTNTRYKVAQGDTLQKISIKHYNNPDDWKRIYDHNKLTSTVLSPGKILEIPKK